MWTESNTRNQLSVAISLIMSDMVWLQLIFNRFIINYTPNIFIMSISSDPFITKSFWPRWHLLEQPPNQHTCTFRYYHLYGPVNPFIDHDLLLNCHCLCGYKITTINIQLFPSSSPICSLVLYSPILPSPRCYHIH